MKVNSTPLSWLPSLPNIFGDDSNNITTVAKIVTAQIAVIITIALAIFGYKRYRINTPPQPTTIDLHAKKAEIDIPFLENAVKNSQKIIEDLNKENKTLQKEIETLKQRVKLQAIRAGHDKLNALVKLQRKTQIQQAFDKLKKHANEAKIALLKQQVQNLEKMLEKSIQFFQDSLHDIALTAKKSPTTYTPEPQDPKQKEKIMQTLLAASKKTKRKTKSRRRLQTPSHGVTNTLAFQPTTQIPRTPPR